MVTHKESNRCENGKINAGNGAKWVNEPRLYNNRFRDETARG